MIKEFREFIMRGNVLDLAIGFIMGTAFSGIVSSMVNDIIMPPIGLILGKMDFNSLYINLSGTQYASLADAKAAGAATINYGLFISALLNFIVIASVAFLIIRAVNRMTPKKEPVAEAPTTKECPYCCSTIAIKATRCPECTSEISG